MPMKKYLALIPILLVVVVAAGCISMTPGNGVTTVTKTVFQSTTGTMTQTSTSTEESSSPSYIVIVLPYHADTVTYKRHVFAGPVYNGTWIKYVSNQTGTIAGDRWFDTAAVGQLIDPARTAYEMWYRRTAIVNGTMNEYYAYGTWDPYNYADYTVTSRGSGAYSPYFGGLNISYILRASIEQGGWGGALGYYYTTLGGKTWLLFMFTGDPWFLGGLRGGMLLTYVRSIDDTPTYSIGPHVFAFYAGTDGKLAFGGTDPDDLSVMTYAVSNERFYGFEVADFGGVNSYITITATPWNMSTSFMPPWAGESYSFLINDVLGG